MKKSLVLAMAMALGVTASAYAANPFSDVPAGHWAYDSINKLAAAGVIEGYGDTTFGGDKLMTRYEMAQIVAKAMAKGANVDKLAAEFADELDNLGVRVANLEKKADNVKITGTIKASYASYSGDLLGSTGDAKATPSTKRDTNHQGRLRSDLWIKGDINDDWTFSAMFRNQQFFTGEEANKGEEDVAFQRAYVNGRVGGLAVQAGRYNFTDMTATAVGGNIYDTRMDGVQASYGSDVKLTAGYGKATDGNKVSGSYDNDVVYAELKAKIGAVDAGAGYYKFSDVANLENEDDNIWTVGVGFDLAKDLKLTANYLKTDYDKVASTGKSIDDDGYVVALAYKGAKASQAGSWGLNAEYFDLAKGTVIAHGMDGVYGTEGFKGYAVGASYALAKNIVAGVTYYDLESKADSNIDNETLWSQVVFSF